MHRIEFTGLSHGQMNAFLRHDAQASLFEFGIDLAGQVAAGCIRFDD